METSAHTAERIFDHLEALRLELGGKVDGLAISVAKLSTQCDVCRPLILGNGKRGIDVRVDRLEGIVGRIRWGLTAVVAPLVVYACYALLAAWLTKK